MQNMLFCLSLVLAVLGPGAAPAAPKLSHAIFAGGCFWSMTPPFELQPGVTEVKAGYIGGQGDNPTYEDYADRGFVEAVLVTYDPTLISYQKLLDIYWRQVDPTDSGGQFVDRGPEYRPGIYYLDPGQKKLAEVSEKALARSGKFNKPIAVEIVPATTFWQAEEYHQDYYKKNSIQYHLYRYGSGRDQFLDSVWGKGHHYYGD